MGLTGFINRGRLLRSWEMFKPQVQFQTQGQLQDSGNLQQQQPQQTQHQVSQTQTPNPAEQTSHAHPLPRGVNRCVQSPTVFNWVV